jgi:large subunit ribosomal protein L21
VIRAGGKQYKVAEGDVIQIEKIDDSGSVEFEPILVVEDGGRTRSASGDLSGSKVTAEVVGPARGPKVDIYKFRNKTRYRRHTGHRQHYTEIRISGITVPGAKKSTAKSTAGGS